MIISELSKQWIKYLKSNQVVSMNSDPVTGKLVYQKPVYEEYIKIFLNAESGLEDACIEKIIRLKLTGKSSTLDTATDADHFVDDPGIAIAEQDVKNIFDAVILSQKKEHHKVNNKEEDITNEEIKGTSKYILLKLKETISEAMTPKQRRLFLNSLDGLRRDIKSLHTSQVKHIFTTLIRGEKRGGFLARFPTKNKKITLYSLELKWCKRGFPISHENVCEFLRLQGFGEAVIKNAFRESEDFDVNDDFDEVYYSEAVLKISKYAFDKLSGSELDEVMA